MKKHKMKFIKKHKIGAAFLLSLCLLFTFFTLVSAVPPFQQTASGVGVRVEAPVLVTHSQNGDFKFHIHTYNTTDGTRLDNSSISCMIHLYSPLDGSHLIEDTMSFDSNGIDFEYEVLGGNFTEIGQYAVLIDCENTKVGGFIEYGFDVTPAGIGIANGPTFYWIIILLSLGVVIFGLLMKDATITILGSFGLYFFGLYTLFYGVAGVRDTIYTWGISIIVLGLAFYISVKAAHDLIVD